MKNTRLKALVTTVCLVYVCLFAYAAYDTYLKPYTPSVTEQAATAEIQAMELRVATLQEELDTIAADFDHLNPKPKETNATQN